MALDEPFTQVALATRTLVELPFRGPIVPNASPQHPTREGHLSWMLARAIGFLETGNVEKAYVWLGFVQGALAARGIFLQELDVANQDVPRVGSYTEWPIKTPPVTRSRVMHSRIEITVYQDSDVGSLGPDATHDTLDGYCANLAKHLSDKFPAYDFTVEQALGGRSKGLVVAGNASDEQLEPIREYVRDLTAGDGWTDLVPAPLGVDYEGRGSRRLEAELKKLVGDAGEVILATLYEPAKGGGWAAVLSTEYAGLKVFYRYRHCDVHLDRNDKGWVVALRPSGVS